MCHVKALGTYLGCERVSEGLYVELTLVFKVKGYRFEMMRGNIWNFLIAVFNNVSFLMFYGV